MELAVWRDIAIVFLAIESVVLVMIVLVAVYFAVRGLNATQTRLPDYLYKAQEISHMVRSRTEDASNRVGEPLLRGRRQTTRAGAILQALVPGRAAPAAATKPSATPPIATPPISEEPTGEP